MSKHEWFSKGSMSMCLSSLGRFLNKAVIKQIQEDQFTCVIWSQKVSDELSQKGYQREKILFFGRHGSNCAIIVLGKILIQKKIYKETANIHH